MVNSPVTGQQVQKLFPLPYLRNGFIIAAGESLAAGAKFKIGNVQPGAQQNGWTSANGYSSGKPDWADIQPDGFQDGKVPDGWRLHLLGLSVALLRHGGGSTEDVDRIREVERLANNLFISTENTKAHGKVSLGLARDFPPLTGVGNQAVGIASPVATVCDAHFQPLGGRRFAQPITFEQGEQHYLNCEWLRGLSAVYSWEVQIFRLCSAEFIG